MMTYKDAGVDIDAADTLIDRLKERFPDIGGFGGFYPVGDQYLVAGTDGVGTKLKLAFATGNHDTIGIDLVAMSVNDVVTSGARPLFFLDYFATSKLDVDLAERVISSVAMGCREAGCLLLGGETAEMPDFYSEGEYDLSGFCVGMVHKDYVIDGQGVEVGDLIVSLPSSGFHSNGYSLIRKVLEERRISLDDSFDGGDQTVGEMLLTPTRIYAKEVLSLVDEFLIKGIAHITGGGLIENIPRILPPGTGALIERESWDVPHAFRWIQEAGNIPEVEMYRTFNMGVGMAMVMSPHEARCVSSRNEEIKVIGRIIGDEGVHLS